jgi:DNA polymerase-3 subunit epsilon
MSAASDRLSQIEFIAFDFETTGLRATDSRIVEIGAVRFRGEGTVVNRFQQLVDPECEIPREAIRIHGITNQTVAGQPVMGEVLPRFLGFVGDAPLVMMAHNARFDISFLAAACKRFRTSVPIHPVIDTCELARCRHSLPNYKLETLGRHFRLVDIERHRALDDAQLLMDVFLRLIRERPAIHSIAELYQLAPGLSFGPSGRHSAR